VSETLYVTPAQVLAAKLALELSEEAGEAPDAALKAIAHAQVATPQQSIEDREIQAPAVATPDSHDFVGRRHRWPDDEEDRDNPQRGAPPKRAVPGFITPPDPYRDTGEYGGGSEVGAEPLPSKYVPTEDEEKVARTLADHDQRLEELRRSRRGRDDEETDRDPDERGSRGDE
jgi:hypothetical protein